MASHAAVSPLPSRRLFVERLAKSVMLLPAVSLYPGGFLFGQGGARERSTEPLVTSFDLSLINDWLIPSELFFIREHFPAPDLAAKNWTIAITGAVAKPLKITYEELLRRPRVELAAVLECAGNPVGGGMVGNAEWSGARLGALLQEAGPLPDARYVRLVGADGEPGGGMPYSRSLPLPKALHSDTLLVYGMNHEILPHHNGFPVRAIVPGWYGMDSVKWLQRVEVLTELDNSPIMTQRYLREVRQADGTTAAEPVTSMRVKSAFSRPLDGAIVLGRRFLVRGVAWAGENRVRTVQISTDKGATWNDAELISDHSMRSRRYSWVLWKYNWNIASPGSHELMARATDDQGNTQPAERPPARRDVHELNHYERVQCTVA
jgi:DMSO/TMAO reductase YedYZ molybdopterin-dependent catalytic subunit